GGHTHTHNVEIGNEHFNVDTGFIVFNHSNYPNFSRLLETLAVESQPTSMSFSVQCACTGLEYNGTSINTLFAQRRNLFRPGFYRMVRDILRFNKAAPDLLAGDDNTTSLADFVVQKSYSDEFRDHYLIPMCAALWSAPRELVEQYPIRFLVRFFHNHGMLNINDRPQWRVIKGGSNSYVRALMTAVNGRVRVASKTAVTEVRRHSDAVSIHNQSGEHDRYDHVILGCHSDQALKLLASPTTAERDILGAITFQDNDTVLHTDAAMLPHCKRAWASWNYHIPASDIPRPTVTYYMNSLQTLKSDEAICVTLNRTADIAPAKILRRLQYQHPQFTAVAVAAQARHAEISGHDRVHYCGAYWGFGFHEDGVNSALRVCKALGSIW
ncbi:MAG: FAD-dependent oxidoreductase, partial [Gammaproteobacteria bacterium]